LAPPFFSVDNSLNIVSTHALQMIALSRSIHASTSKARLPQNEHFRPGAFPCFNQPRRTGAILKSACLPWGPTGLFPYRPPSDASPDFAGDDGLTALVDVHLPLLHHDALGPFVFSF
jgi:hypothetical protein